MLEIVGIYPSSGWDPAAALSTVVEWYDFTLYLYFATVLARVFFGGGEDSLAITLGGFAVAYLMRPVGAVVFGHIGDRRGRRPMLLLSMLVMSLAMLATALLPIAFVGGLLQSHVVGVLLRTNAPGVHGRHPRISLEGKLGD